MNKEKENTEQIVKAERCAGKSIEDIVSELRPVDDAFFHKLSESQEFCEELLQTIFDNHKIKLRDHTPQRNLRNVKGRSVTVDLLCQDKKRIMYGVEMQRSNCDNYQKRVRYIGSNIDTYITEKGIKYKDLWRVIIIYISEFDVFHGKKTIYHISRTIDELQKKAYNGFDEIYVNTKIHDGSLLA